jgi:parallel beta-helix repeat protein
MRERAAMKKNVWRHLGCVVALTLAATACSTPERETAPSEAAGQDAGEGCTVGADRIVERLEIFLDELPDQTPDEFLAQEEVEGLAAFQDDVAGIIAETTDQRSTLCNLDGLQTLIAERLTEAEPEGVLETFLLNTVLRGGELSTADVAIGPDDDIENVLGLLDDGSTVTLAPGTYDFVRPLIIQRDIALIGAGQEETTIRSSAGDAAIVVVGRGLLRTRDLTIEHTGAEQASVVVAFGRPVDVATTTLRGGVADGEGAGGNALVLTDDVFGGGEFDPDQPPSVISDTALEGNAGAGLVVDGALAPVVERTSIADNQICGACFFATASGVIEDSQFTGNSFGIQVGDQATVVARNNTVSANTVAGVVIVGQANVLLETNQIFDNVEAGIVIQEAASATVRENTVGAQPFGLSILTTGVVDVIENTFDGPEVGIQVDESSTPNVVRNTILATSAVGIAHAASSAGTFIGNVVEPTSGVAALAEGTSAPVVEDLTVNGGEVAFAFAGETTAVLSGAQFSGQSIGAQTDELSSPTLTNVVIRDATDAGFVVRAESTPTVTGIDISGFGEVAIAVADQATATVANATVSSGRNGASLVGSSFEDIEVGIQVGESSTPMLENNEVIAPSSVGFVFIDDAGGEMLRNRVTDPGLVGVQLGGNVTPALVENVFFLTRPEDGEALPAVPDGDGETDPDDTSEPVENPIEDSSGDASDDLGEGGEEPAQEEVDDAIVGLLYAENAAGTATSNQVVGFVIGFQVGDMAAPELVENVVDGGVWLGVGFLYRDDASGLSRANQTANHGVGFQLSDRSTPTLIENTVTRIRDVAFLVQGAANPVLEKNICPEGAAGIGVLDDTTPTLVDNECAEVSG